MAQPPFDDLCFYNFGIPAPGEAQPRYEDQDLLLDGESACSIWTADFTTVPETTALSGRTVPSTTGLNISPSTRTIPPASPKLQTRRDTSAKSSLLPASLNYERDDVYHNVQTSRKEALECTRTTVSLPIAASLLRKESTPYRIGPDLEARSAATTV